jgi:polysaccharide biosynthesis protein PslH
MLTIELDAMGPADILVQLNGEEAATFQNLVPDKRQVLLYPAIGAMPAGAGGGDVIIAPVPITQIFSAFAGFCKRCCRSR